MSSNHQFKLKWRRSYPDSDQFFSAFEPERCGESLVAQVSRNRDPVGRPTDWHWSLHAPGFIGSEFQHTKGGKGNAADRPIHTVREHRDRGAEEGVGRNGIGAGTNDRRRSSPPP